MKKKVVVMLYFRSYKNNSKFVRIMVASFINNLHILVVNQGRAQDYFCSTHGLDYVISLLKSAKKSDLSKAALYTLAMATEGNGKTTVSVLFELCSMIALYEIENKLW